MYSYRPFLRQRRAAALAFAATLAAACGGRVNFDDGSVDSSAEREASADAFTADALVLDGSLPEAGDAAPADDALLDARPVLDADAPADARPLDAAPSDAASSDASACEGGATACTTGAALYCADLGTDPNNCGACGRRCCPGERCGAGVCGGPFGCAPGTIPCASSSGCRACVNTQSDSSNCGMCGRACPAGTVCIEGACATACGAPSTAPPVGMCDGRGMIACQRWAQESAGGDTNATAVCINGPVGCVRADVCDRPDDPSSCRCGSSTACSTNEVCVRSGTSARCECARPSM